MRGRRGVFRVSCSKEEGERVARLIDESGDRAHESENVAVNDVHVLAFLIKVWEWQSLHRSTSIARCPR